VPSFPNPDFETDGSCGTADGHSNPAGWCTEWANGNVDSWSIAQASDSAVHGTSGMTLTFGACQTSPCSGSYPGIYVLSDQATGVESGGWALVRIFGSYDGSDNAGGLDFIDSDTNNIDSYNMITSSLPIEYLLLGPVSSTNLKLRLQISSPTQNNTHARFDWIR